MTVADEVHRLAERRGLPAAAPRQLVRLVHALATEADPPTTIRDRHAIVDRHLADSLVALDVPGVRSARRIADIGSGAGFPGLPLAIALPSARVDLVEASRRKCEAIERLARAAQVMNARVVASRAEEWGAREGSGAYDLVSARAVASLAVVAEYAAPLLALGGSLIAWKGRRDREEERAGRIAARRLGLEYADIVPVVPFAGARDRHLHVLLKREATPDEFPRRAGRAAKRPLG